MASSTDIMGKGWETAVRTTPSSGISVWIMESKWFFFQKPANVVVGHISCKKYAVHFEISVDNAAFMCKSKTTEKVKENMFCKT